MKTSILIFALGTVPALASFSIPLNPLAHPQRIPYATPHSYYEAHVNLAEPEQPRIRRHLAAVEVLLRARPTAGLTDSQRRHRFARLDDLHAYWTRGEFPQNRDFPDRLIPYFIDDEGVPCAMGYLVIQSGHKEYAEEIHDRMNNAYIGEIAAADPRLADWGEANGMTLEEAAMVQPTYGGPMNQVYQVRMDGFSRPWVLGHRTGDVAIGLSLAFQDSARWKFDGNFAFGFCVTKTGIPLLLKSPTALWKTRGYGFAQNVYACEWSANDSDAWGGGDEGLVRLRRGGNADTLARSVFKTSLASDSVTGVTVGTGAVWAATARGLYRRGTQGADTGVVAWDSTTLGGKRVTGVKADGNKVWAGVEGVSIQSIIPTQAYFSTRGILRYNGIIWNRYVSAMSSTFVPSDTIMALAVRDTATAWIAVRSGFYRFPSSSGLGKVADMPAGLAVYDMVGNAQGFYAGTSNGVYQFRNDSLVWLGTPGGVSIRPRFAGKGPQTAPRLRVLSAQEAKGLDNARSVLGQRTGPQAGAGVYIVPD